MTEYNCIKAKIEALVRENRYGEIVLYPFGEMGQMAKRILNECYGIKEAYIIDNHLAKYNKEIQGIEFLEEIDCGKYTFLITNCNPDSYKGVREEIAKYVPGERIVDLFEEEAAKINVMPEITTKVGKYSYGPLCHHWLVESVGAFSSIAPGANVLENHPTQYLSTHPFMYYAASGSDLVHTKAYNDYHVAPWFVPGIQPKGKNSKIKKITIGNDVWIGANALITNGANIGNGVIVGGEVS